MLASGCEGQICPRKRAAVVADYAASFHPEKARIKMGCRSPLGSSNIISGSVDGMGTVLERGCLGGTHPCKSKSVSGKAGSKERLTQ